MQPRTTSPKPNTPRCDACSPPTASPSCGHLTSLDRRTQRETAAPQTQVVLDHLRRHSHLTSWQAEGVYRIRRLASRVDELRAAGFEIETQTCEDASGQRYTRYRLSRRQRRSKAPLLEARRAPSSTASMRCSSCIATTAPTSWASTPTMRPKKSPHSPSSCWRRTHDQHRYHRHSVRDAWLSSAHGRAPTSRSAAWAAPSGCAESSPRHFLPQAHVVRGACKALTPNTSTKSRARTAAARTTLRATATGTATAAAVTTSQPKARSQPTSRKTMSDFAKGEPQALAKRGITEEACRKYGYWIGKDKHGKTVQIANYKRDGGIVAQKLHYPDKSSHSSATRRRAGCSASTSTNRGDASSSPKARSTRSPWRRHSASAGRWCPFRTERKARPSPSSASWSGSTASTRLCSCSTWTNRAKPPRRKWRCC